MRCNVSAVAALVILGASTSCFAQQPGQQSFPSAEAASSALVTAVQSHDEAAVMTILGGGRELIHEDDVETRLLHERFLSKYRQMHRLVREPGGTTLLYIGAENWPFPVPLVSANGAWHFHAPDGLMEVLFRRIGENEAMVIQACQALVAAKQQGDFPFNGAKANDAVRAIAPNGANAMPYYGYYFRIQTLPEQNGTGGARGELAAIVAYPAEYRSSGVMTFMVGPGGALYEKDLGPNTAEIAGTMTADNPDPSWKLVSQAP